MNFGYGNHLVSMEMDIDVNNLVTRLLLAMLE